MIQPVNISDIDAFYRSLNEERNFVDNPAQADIEYAIGIFNDSRLIAVAGVKRRIKVFRFSFYIIKKQYQGLGLSKQLTKQIIEHCITQKASWIFASAYCENQSAVKAWKKQGYKMIYSDGEIARFIYPLNKRGQIVQVLIPSICRLIIPIKKLFSR